MWAGSLFVLGCVAGNLTPGQGSASRLGDGETWNAPGATVLTAPLTVDLEEPKELRALAIQGDNDDSYAIEGSIDGQVWSLIWTAQPRYGVGLRTRHHVLDDATTARFLRVHGLAGDGRYSVSWVGAYCQVPPDFPGDPSRLSPIVFWKGLDDGAVVSVKCLVAAAGALLLAIGAVLRWRRRESILARTRDVLLAVLGVLGFVGWFNFGRFHYDDHIHQWDIYHYYIGAKYLPELGYTRMYECTTIAEAEVFGARWVEGRTITNLGVNLIEPAAPAVADPGRCTSRFSPERWNDFKEDVRFFRLLFSEPRWREVLHDHGYNGTPVWGVLGGAIASLGPASNAQVDWIVLLDPALLVVMWGFVVWAFGWRVTAVALIYWGTNYPARYFWNGGAFLRQDWLATAVIGLCLCKRARPGAGGFFLGVSTLLRIFPGFIIAALVVKTVATCIAERRLSVGRETRRFFIGALVSVAVLVPIAVAVGPARPATVVEFVENSKKHLQTPLTNNMGWKTVVAYQKATRASTTVRPGAPDSWAEWKAARRRVYETRRPIFYAGIAALVLLVGWATLRQPDWVALVLGAGLVVFSAELTSYYYSFALVFALLWPQRPLVGVGLLVVAAVSSYMPRFVFWEDARYYNISLWFVAFVLVATILVGTGLGAPRQDQPMVASIESRASSREHQVVSIKS